MTPVDRTRGPDDEPATLVGLLDELLDEGVHAKADLVIGLADVELVRASLQLLVASEDTAQRTGVPGPATGGNPARGPEPEQRFDPAPRESVRRTPASPRAEPARASRPATASSSRPGAPEPGSAPRSSAPAPGSALAESDRDQLAKGVSQLVLTVVELLHDLIERQAVRRVEADTLTDEQVERLGVALQALEERMEEVKDAFGVSDEDLNIDLGPLGKLR